MLVGRAERSERGGTKACVSRKAVLAKTLCPQLHEPVGHVAQRITVRHENLDMPSVLRIGEVLERCEGSGDILLHRARGTSRLHVRCTREQGSGIDPDQCCGEESDGSENAEPSAHVRWNVQRRDAFAARDGAKCSFLRIGDEDEARPSTRFTQCGREARANDEVLGHRLCRAP